MRQRKQNHETGDGQTAFTILEMAVVIAIISVIAAFGIPAYDRLMVKSQERTLILNLMTIRSAVEIWAAKNNNTKPSGVTWGNLSTINTQLGINVVDQTLTYSCNWTAAPPDRGCGGTLPNGGQIHFHPGHVNGKLHCTGASCPTCPASPGDCG
ncbi:MAG: hypothetical protein A3C36_02885 [Omnitrophica WOR_2 bacterium RIFCSPHIGHO2_02_FULL_52_10]|nr:MAG: hypothetical protein A3C36_02885 [Omnitrophica WOR_2 bacterium RIFCSPHIGHO2_02_FULL_52_10]